MGRPLGVSGLGGGVSLDTAHFRAQDGQKNASCPTLAGTRDARVDVDGQHTTNPGIARILFTCPEAC